METRFVRLQLLAQGIDPCSGVSLEFLDFFTIRRFELLKLGVRPLFFFLKAFLALDPKLAQMVFHVSRFLRDLDLIGVVKLFDLIRSSFHEPLHIVSVFPLQRANFRIVASLKL